MSITDTIPIIAICGECGATFRRDPVPPASPIDVISAWSFAHEDLRRHRALKHLPDSWEKLASDMLVRFGNGSPKSGGPSFLARFNALMGGR